MSKAVIFIRLFSLLRPEIGLFYNIAKFENPPSIPQLLIFRTTLRPSELFIRYHMVPIFLVAFFKKHLTMCINIGIFVYKEIAMRTNIDIDDRLMRDAMAATKLKSKKEVVHVALSELVRLSKQKNILRFRGKAKWEGDLDQMRAMR